MKRILLAATAICTLAGTTAFAQPGWVPPGNPPDGYYSQADHTGYYDRDGRYRHIRFDDRYRDNPPPNNFDGPPPPPDYRGASDCHRDNRATGTVLGAVAGGLIGGFASHGNGLATVGGVIGGGILGNAIAGDIDCDDQPVAYPVYIDSLDGDIGRQYEWHHGANRGVFVSTREYRRGGLVCRDFTETSWRHGEQRDRSGTACRERGTGHWRFD
jgi:surface antigen